ncbi:MAG: TRAP transporter small permease subunit [Hyphomicrobiaceae bacterium]|nr:TRAP transporter small permease subunit [Hyphomicrobiaceae bacterium]
MYVLETIHSVLARLSRYAVWVAGAAMLLAAIMVTVDVLCRKIFSITMSGSDEISGYVFAAGTTWSYSYCLIHRSNIRIDALYNLLAPIVRAVLDLVGLVLLFIYIGYLTLKSWDVFFTSWSSDPPSLAVSSLATPLWIPQMFWVSGLIMFVVTLAFLIVYAAVALVTGDIQRVQNVAGTLSVEEEIEEETHGIEELRSKSNGGGA